MSPYAAADAATNESVTPTQDDQSGGSTPLMSEASLTPAAARPFRWSGRPFVAGIAAGAVVVALSFGGGAALQAHLGGDDSDGGSITAAAEATVSLWGRDGGMGGGMGPDMGGGRHGGMGGGMGPDMGGGRHGGMGGGMGPGMGGGQHGGMGGGMGHGMGGGRHGEIGGGMGPGMGGGRDSGMGGGMGPGMGGGWDGGMVGGMGPGMGGGWGGGWDGGMVGSVGSGGWGGCDCDCSWSSGGPQGSCVLQANDQTPCWRCCCQSFYQVDFTRVIDCGRPTCHEHDVYRKIKTHKHHSHILKPGFRKGDIVLVHKKAADAWRKARVVRRISDEHYEVRYEANGKTAEVQKHEMVLMRMAWWTIILWICFWVLIFSVCIGLIGWLCKKCCGKKEDTPTSWPAPLSDDRDRGNRSCTWFGAD